MRKITILFLILLASLLLLIVKKEPTPDFDFTNVEVETTNTNATIWWTTSVETRYVFEYYAEENFTHWGVQGFDGHDYSLNFSITLYNVKLNATYRFRVTAIDVEGNREYFESNFTTSARETSIIQSVEAIRVEKSDDGIIPQLFNSVLVVVIFSSLFFLVKRNQ